MLSKFFSWVKTLLKRLLSLFKREGDDVLNKELLLCNGDTKPQKTHTISVAIDTTYGLSRGYYVETPYASPYGSLTPNTINGVKISGLTEAITGGEISISFGEPMQNQMPYSIVYITRLDTNKKISLPKDTRGYQYYTAFNAQFFSESDVGKNIELNIEVA